jgi:outer membrane biosynthesis protein TonB
MKTRQSILLLILLTCLMCFSRAQQDSLQFDTGPTPVIGWDSLRALIVYPEILRRAAFEGAAVVIMDVDSSGVADSAHIFANYPTFELSVRAAMRHTRWHPSRHLGKPVNGMVSFNVHFYVKGHEKSRMSIEVEPSKLLKLESPMLR